MPVISCARIERNGFRIKFKIQKNALNIKITPEPLRHALLFNNAKLTAIQIVWFKNNLIKYETQTIKQSCSHKIGKLILLDD
jgi:hypothetical protein